MKNLFNPDKFVWTDEDSNLAIDLAISLTESEDGQEFEEIADVIYSLSQQDESLVLGEES